MACRIIRHANIKHKTQPILPGRVTLAAFYAGINRLFLFFMLRNEKGRSLAKNQEILVKITIISWSIHKQEA
jgi:hypothetical protein